MNHLIVLAAIVILPVLVIVALRVNAAIAFMSLCLGSVLVRYTASDMSSITSSLSSKAHAPSSAWVSLALLIIPFVLTIFFTRKNVSGGKTITNFLPAVACGLLFALLITPLLGNDLQAQIESQQAWRTLDNLQTAVILAGAFFSLVFLLFSHRVHSGGEEKRARHKA